MSIASDRFTGNLSTYGREFASKSPVNTSSLVASPNAVACQIDKLLRRYNLKKNRVTLRVIYPQQATMSNDSTGLRAGSLVGKYRKAFMAIVIVGLVLTGAALGRSWEMSQEKLSTVEPVHEHPSITTNQRSLSNDGASFLSPESDDPASVSAAAVARNINDIAIVSLKDLVVELDQLTNKFRDEADMLRTENGSLVNANVALTDETIELNQELLELEMTVLALQDEQENDSDVESRVIYNFVNVPVGSDPSAIDKTTYDSQASDGQKLNSSYNNLPLFSGVSSGESELSESSQQLADEPSDESLDELIQIEIEKRRN